MGSEQYIHPIIEAFVAGRQHALQKAELAQKGQQFTASQEQQKQLEEERLQNEQQFRDAQLKQAQQGFELTKALAAYQHQSDTLKALQGVREQGGDVGQAQQFLNKPPDWFSQSGQTASSQSQVSPQAPSGSAPGTAPMPISQQNSPQVDLSGALGPDPATRMQQMIDFEGKKAGAVANAQLPAEQAKQNALFKQQLELQTNETQAKKDAAATNQAFESTENAKKITSEENLAKLSRGAQMTIEGMRESGENSRALLPYGIGPSSGALTERQAMLATGQIKPDVNNKMDAVAMEANSRAGVVNVDPKDIEALKKLNGLPAILQEERDYAKKYLPSEKELGPTKAKAEAFIQQHVLPEQSDTKQEYGKILGQITNFGQDLEGMTGGRILSQQMKSELASYAGPGMTREQALSKIEAQGTAFYNKQQNQLLSGVKPGQKELIYQKHGIKPAYEPTVKYPDGKTGILNTIDSDKAGHAVYDVQ